MEGTWKHKPNIDVQGVLGYLGGKAIINFGRHAINNT